jgi:pilus assembly protein CpaC
MTQRSLSPPAHWPAGIAAALATATIAVASLAAAQVPERPEPITLYVGEAHVINEPGVRRIAVGNGRVLQATALDDRQVLVLPEAPGQSTLLLWGRSGPERSHVFNVLPADTGRLLAEVRAMLGDTRKVSVRVVGDKVLVEGAEVSEEVSARIVEIARRYPQVVNLLPKVGQERMIAMDVKFIEIRRDLLENIGVKWGASMQGPSFQVIGDAQRSSVLRPGGAAEGSGLQVGPRIPPFATSLSIASSLSSMLNLLVQSGDAVILAEPRLSCRSGGSARFVAGGELPIPVAGALGTSSVGFKEYGIKFDVSPVASDSGLIAARIATEISAVNFEVAVREVPGLTKRRAETDVSLRENETLVIAGLLTEEGARNMDRVAGAAELPVLGALFRSRQFRDRQTELVVFITPRFVEGAAMPAAASAIRSEPMRGPARLLPGVPGTKVAPAALDGMPAEVGAAAARPAAIWGRSTQPTTVPAAPARDAAAQAAATAESVVPSAPPAEGEDRGTARRWRDTRDRVRMID